MERRSFVRLICASVSVAFLAGCLGGGGEPEEDEGNGEGNASSKKDESAEEDGVSLEETEFEVEETGGGTRRDSVSVDFGEETRTVTVEGSLTGRNSCYTAELESVEYDSVEDVLSVSVRSFEDREEDEMCTQVMTEIEYRFTASFVSGLPERATVRHDGETVAEAARDV